jgi:putative hemolysin
MKLVVVTLSLLAGLSAATCNNESSVGPEPKSCEARGGVLETFETSQGPRELCELPDGTRCKAGEQPGQCVCQACPQLVPPAPGSCLDGTIVVGAVDECGCHGPARCEVEASATAP